MPKREWEEGAEKRRLPSRKGCAGRLDGARVAEGGAVRAAAPGASDPFHAPAGTRFIDYWLADGERIPSVDFVRETPEYHERGA